MFYFKFQPLVLPLGPLDQKQVLKKSFALLKNRDNVSDTSSATLSQNWVILAPTLPMGRFFFVSCCRKYRSLSSEISDSVVGAPNRELSRSAWSVIVFVREVSGAFWGISSKIKLSKPFSPPPKRGYKWSVEEASDVSICQKVKVKSAIIG